MTERSASVQLDLASAKSFCAAAARADAASTARGCRSGWMTWMLCTPGVRAGLEILQPPRDEPWGVREMLVRHPDGHTFRMSQPSQHRH